MENIKTVKIKLSGLHCTSCVMNIEGELEDTPGVKKARANYAKSEAEITYDESALKLEKILEIISKLGYGAELAA